jgi:4'-phosphopantetheinyl transferase
MPLLANDERERAARFRFDHLRHSFVIARAALRCLVGRYLGLHPADVEFRYGSRGKPSVPSEFGIQFNTSHSGGLVVAAFAAGIPLGIDVELLRPMPDANDLASRFFCAEEAEELAALPASQRDAAFFNCWTRKEAYIKAIGDGLSAPLDGFRVTLRPGDSARFIHISRDTTAAAEWTLQDLRTTDGYKAALAYRDRRRTVQMFPAIDSAEFTAAI